MGAAQSRHAVHVLPPAALVSQDNVEYNLRPVKAPVLRGLAFRTFLLISGSWIFPLLRSALMKKNDVYKVLRDTFIPEAPTFEPRLSPSTPAAQAEVNAVDSFTNVQSLSVVERLQTCYTLSAGCKKDTRFPSIADYHEAYKSGRTTPTAVAEAILKLIQSHPACRNTFSSHTPEDVLQQAAASTARYAKGAPLGPLDGVPYAVKDNIDAAPYPTGDGSVWMADRRQLPKDSAIVAKLRECGAVLLGKTAMHESGMGISGLNIKAGTPLNPYSPPDNPRYTGASSSGSAAVVALGLCPFALGNDGGGSIRIPAAFCGLSGLKVTFGRVASPHTHGGYSSVTVQGPIASCMRDVALVYSVIANNGAEVDPLPPLTLPHLQQLSSPKPLAGKTVAVYWKWFEAAEPAVLERCKSMLKRMENAGATLTSVTIPELEELSLAHTTTIMTDIGSSLQPHLHSKDVRRKMNPDLLLNMRIVGGHSSIMYLQAQRIRTRAMYFFQKVFDQANFIATPTVPILAPPAHPTALCSGESNVVLITKVMTYMQAANFAGYPAISVPAGVDSQEGLPIGFHLMGRSYQEATLLHAAAVLEARTDGLPKPHNLVPSPLNV